MEFKINYPLRITYNPKEDITTFELAQILPFIIGTHPIYEGDSILEEGYMRHFDVINTNE